MSYNLYLSCEVTGEDFDLEQTPSVFTDSLNHLFANNDNEKVREAYINWLKSWASEASWLERHIAEMDAFIASHPSCAFFGL